MSNPLVEVRPSNLARYIARKYPEITVGEVHRRATKHNKAATKKNKDLHQRKRDEIKERLGREPAGREWGESREFKEFRAHWIDCPATRNLSRCLNMEMKVSEVAMRGLWTAGEKSLFWCLYVITGDSKLSL